MTATPTRLYAGRLAAGATPTYTRSAASTNGTSVANQTFPMPSYSVGDVVFFNVASNVSPSGYISSGNNPGWTFTTSTYTSTLMFGYKLMTDTSQTSLASTWPAGYAITSQFAVYSGADTLTVVGNQSTAGTNTTLPAPSATTTTSVYVALANTSNGTYNYTFSGPTLRLLTNGNYSVVVADSTLPANYSSSPGTVQAAYGGLNTYLLSRQTSSVSTLYTATAKTVITSIVVAGGSAAGGKPVIQVAGYDVVRGVSLGQGVTTKLSPGIVIESGETIQGFFEGGYPSGTTQGPDILISGVVMT